MKRFKQGIGATERYVSSTRAYRRCDLANASEVTPATASFVADSATSGGRMVTLTNEFNS